MRKTDIDLLFSYNRWANAKIITTSRNLSNAQIFEPAPSSFGSLFGTLVHILGAEIVWRMRLQQGISPNQMAQVEEYASLDNLAAHWQEEEKAMQQFLNLLQNEDMDRKVTFKRLNGSFEEATVWKALAHVVLHGMQFRSEAGMILTAAGHTPGDLDFVYFLRDIQER